MSSAAFTLVRNGDDFAVYVRQPDSTTDTRWHLTSSGTDSTGQSQGVALTMGGAQISTETDLPHLNAGGTWMETVNNFTAPTPRQRLEAEITNLRTEAHRLRESAGYSGSHDDGGASQFDDKADGIQFALDVIFGEQNPDTARIRTALAPHGR